MIRRRHLAAASVWLFVFVVYSFTLCPTIYLIDAGELTTVAATLGIAHPTGYPLYTLLARLAVLMPAGSVAVRVNVLSALLGSCAAFVFYILLQRLLKDSLLALVPTSLLAFSHTLWNTSLSAEVYPLTALFITLMLLLVRPLSATARLYLMAFVAGLACTNHMIIATVLLPLAVYVLVRHRPKPSHTFAALAFFALGLSVYFYLPVRSAQDPLLNWGNPHTLERFIWHTTGKQYRVWMFSSPAGEILVNLKNELVHIAREWLYVYLVLIGLGLRNLYRADRPFFWLCIGIVVVNLLYGINYSIPDIETYFLPTIVILCLVSGYGLYSLKRYLKKWAALAAALMPLLLNFASSTLQDNYGGYDLGKNILASLPSNSIVLTDYWDIYSPAIYIREIEKQHGDIWVIDKELLRRSWYFRYLEHEYPALYRDSRTQIDRYGRLLDDFEHDRLKNPEEIQRCYIDMINSFVERNSRQRRCFVLLFGSPMDNAQILPSWSRTPYGFAYELAESLSTAVFDYARFHIRKPPFTADPRLRYNMNIYRKVALDRAGFLERLGRVDEAQRVRDWIRREFD